MAKKGSKRKSDQHNKGRARASGIPPGQPDSHDTLLAHRFDSDIDARVVEDDDPPFYHNGDETPMLAKHVRPARPNDGRADNGSDVPLFPHSSHDTHTRKIKRYGWTRDLPDARDHFYAAPHFLALPRTLSVRNYCPAVYDQGDLGSCGANAIAAAVQFERMRQSLPRAEGVPSRLFIYYNQRVIENDVTQDHGAQIRDGIKSVAALGACFEGKQKGEWRYDPTKFADKPPAPCYAQASLDRAVSYSRLLQQLDQLKGCLASGSPFIFGFTCYESFESEDVADSGVLALPRPSEHVVGGHAVMAVGYDDINARFEIRNSWGPDWGDGGYFTMPYSYVTNPCLCGDFWTVRLVTAPTGGL